MSAESEEIEIMVEDAMGWPRTKVLLWMGTRNPNFGGASPNQLIAAGRGHKVRRFVEACIEANQPPEPPSGEVGG